MTTEAKREVIARIIRENVDFDHADQGHFLRAADAIMSLAEPQVPDDAVQPRVERWRKASIALGAWMSAALDDHYVCDAMKSDIREWFSAGEPFEAMAPASEPQALSEDRARDALIECMDERHRTYVRLREGDYAFDVTSRQAIRAMIRFATETQKGSGE